MYRTKEDTQRRKDAKRQGILDAAAAVFSSKGYHNTTVKDVVNEARVSVGSFYFYFHSKEELFAELYRSIAEEFRAVSASVLNVEAFPLLKNYTRVMIATLWMYEKKRGIARIMQQEVLTANPSFQRLELERMEASVAEMTEWFRRFKQHHKVAIPDERVAALIYTASYDCLVRDYLASDGSGSLLQAGYAFCVYHLQALGIAFDADTVMKYINEVQTELKSRTASNASAERNSPDDEKG